MSRFLRSILAAALGLFLITQHAGGQSRGYFLGESVSRGSDFGIVCIASGCGPAFGSSNRPVRSLVVGVERRLADQGVGHIAVSAALSRRGWYTGQWITRTTLSLPVMAVIDPWSPLAPFSIAAGVGLTSDVALDRISASRLSLTAGFWVRGWVHPDVQVSFGLRESRGIRRQDYLHIRTRVVTLGIAMR